MAFCDHPEPIDNLVDNFGRWMHYLLIITSIKNTKQQGFLNHMNKNRLSSKSRSWNNFFNFKCVHNMNAKRLYYKK